MAGFRPVDFIPDAHNNFQIHEVGVAHGIPLISHLLTVADNGKGLPADFDPAGAHGLGMQVIGSAVSKLQGTLGFGSNPKGADTKFSVRFLPADSKK